MNLDQLQYEQDTEPHYCPVCDSADAQILGALGQRIHLRCRGCGIDFSFRRELHEDDFAFANPDHQFQD